MYHLLPYIPYAAVGYCVAKTAADIWPTLRSQTSAISYSSSRHGLDGEYGPQDTGYCPPSGGGEALGPRSRNHACFDEQTSTIVGGEWDGAQPGPSQVSIYEDRGVRLASIHLGDSRLEIPCKPRHLEKRKAPVFRRALCPWNRGQDSGRLNRKLRRWG